MDEIHFREKALEALEQIPQSFRVNLANLEIIVEDFADTDTLLQLNIGSRWDLLGLYSGQPLSARSFFDNFNPPCRIHLFRLPILMSIDDDDSLVEVIREIILHEIGHHFGFSDEDLYSFSGSLF
jgi:predicted Zn-dependent protease with MMP-like domain